MLMPNVLHVLPYVHIQFARNLERLAVNSGLFANIDRAVILLSVMQFIYRLFLLVKDSIGRGPDD